MCMRCDGLGEMSISFAPLCKVQILGKRLSTHMPRIYAYTPPAVGPSTFLFHRARSSLSQRSRGFILLFETPILLNLHTDSKSVIHCISLRPKNTTGYT